jgi:hypothetical protein
LAATSGSYAILVHSSSKSADLEGTTSDQIG